MPTRTRGDVPAPLTCRAGAFDNEIEARPPADRDVVTGSSRKMKSLSAKHRSTPPGWQRPSLVFAWLPDARPQ